jgi:hypothetical protein
MADERRSVNLAALSTVVEAELTAATSRKTSLETRAGSVIVAAGAVVTVFLTLRQALGLDLALLDSVPAAFVLWGLIFAGAALVAGVVGATPLRYMTLDGEYFRYLLRDELERPDLKEELVDLRAIALTQTTNANAFKGLIVFIGYALITISLALLTIALFIAGTLVS